MDNKEIIIARLELIAAKAKILVNDYRFGKLWDGDLSRGLEELKKEIDKISKESGQDTNWGR